MFRSFIIAVLVWITFASPAFADALHLNPSQMPGARSLEEFGQTTMPVGYYEFCRRYREQCDRPAGREMVELTEDRWRALVEVNWIANTIVAPRTDQQIFGVEERWDYPTNVGDCEDYVLLKRKLLAERGFPLGALRITVGLDAEGGGHAVLTVVTDLGDFVLDNVEQEIKRWDQAEIQYLKWQSGDDLNSWVSLVNPVVAARQQAGGGSTARLR